MWLHSAYTGCVPADWSADLSQPIRRQIDERGHIATKQEDGSLSVDRHNYMGKQRPVIMLSQVFFKSEQDCDVTVHSKQTTKKKYICY